ncbi:MAG: exosortase [Terriglobales bacterium]
MSTLDRIVAAPPRTRSDELWAFSLLGALLIALYAPVLTHLVGQWWSDPNYGHGFLVPVLSGYLLWRSRDAWRDIPWRPRASGAFFIVASLLLLAAGTLAAELFLSRISLLVLLGGLVVFFAGWRLLRAWSFPFGFLLFMIPLPAIIYYQITFPLQLLASRLAGFCLDLLQVPALREGNLIVLPNYTLAVAEACSGIRSLLSLLALAVAFGYLLEPRLWKRFALVVLMVPIAIATNALRIVGTGVMTFAFGSRWAEGFFHAFSGWLMFVVAFAFMLLAHRALQFRTRRGKELP